MTSAALAKTSTVLSDLESHVRPAGRGLLEGLGAGTGASLLTLYGLGLGRRLGLPISPQFLQLATGQAGLAASLLGGMHGVMASRRNIRREQHPVTDWLIERLQNLH